MRESVCHCVAPSHPRGAMQRPRCFSGGVLSFAQTFDFRDLSTLQWIETVVEIDGETFPDSWSPLAAALECGSADDLRHVVALYTAHPIWSAVVPISSAMAVTGVSNDTADEHVAILGFMGPCVQLSAHHPEAAARLSDAFSSVGRVWIPIRAFLDDSGDLVSGVEKLLLSPRWGASVGVLFTVDQTSDASRHRLLTGNMGIGLRHMTLFNAIVSVQCQRGGGVLTSFVEDLEAYYSPSHDSNNETRFIAPTDVAATLAAHTGTSLFRRLLPHTRQLVSLYLSLASSPPSDVECLQRSITALLEFETERPCLSAPTPGRNQWASETQLPPEWCKSAAACGTRADLLRLALAAAPSDSLPPSPILAGLWRTFISLLGTKVFGPGWDISDTMSVDADANEDSYAREETRLGLRRLTTAALSDTPAVHNAPEPLSERFRTATEGFARIAKRYPDSVKLQFYGLFKQASCGDVTGSRPWAIDFEGRAKYDAWAARRGLSNDAAMLQYVEDYAKLERR